MALILTLLLFFIYSSLVFELHLMLIITYKITIKNALIQYWTKSLVYIFLAFVVLLILELVDFIEFKDGEIFFAGIGFLSIILAVSLALFLRAHFKLNENLSEWALYMWLEKITFFVSCCTCEHFSFSALEIIS